MTSGYTSRLICYKKRKKRKKRKKNLKNQKKKKKNPLNHHCLIQCQVASLDTSVSSGTINNLIVNQSIRQSLFPVSNQKPNGDHQ